MPKGEVMKQTRRIAVIGGAALALLLAVAFVLDRLNTDPIWFLPVTAVVLLIAIRAASLKQA